MNLGEGDDFLEAARDLGSTHSEDCAVEKNVFAASEFGVEPCTNFKQACHTAHDLDLTRGRAGDPGQDFQERAFPRAIAPDDADYIAGGHIESHILERPEAPCGHGVIVSPLSLPGDGR